MYVFMLIMGMVSVIVGLALIFRGVPATFARIAGLIVIVLGIIVFGANAFNLGNGRGLDPARLRIKQVYQVGQLASFRGTENVTLRAIDRDEFELYRIGLPPGSGGWVRAMKNPDGEVVLVPMNSNW